VGRTSNQEEELRQRLQGRRLKPVLLDICRAAQWLELSMGGKKGWGETGGRASAARQLFKRGRMRPGLAWQ
jgi:hypothetical protein